MTRVVQVALSCLRPEASFAWYSIGLGFAPAGTRRPTAPLSGVQGVADAVVDEVLWLVDRQDFFQLELFVYSSPPVRALPVDHAPSDIGYTRMGVWVKNFDDTLEKLREFGTLPIAPVVGSVGHRRACVRDPEGVFVELMEDDTRPPTGTPDARPEIPAAVRSVTVSVPDITSARRYFADTLGFEQVGEGTAFRTDAHEAAWGLAHVENERLILAAGDVWLEVVKYHHARPRGEDYRISDQGILNIAVGFRTRPEFTAVRDAVHAAGYRLLEEISREQLNVQYAEDENRFSVELGYFDEKLDPIQGFSPIDANSV